MGFSTLGLEAVLHQRRPVSAQEKQRLVERMVGAPSMAPGLMSDQERRARLLLRPADAESTKDPGLNGHGYRPAPEDEMLLARAIYAETSNIPEDSEAIGWSMINRIGQREFGNSLQDVLYQKRGFAFTPNGGGPAQGSAQWIGSAHPELLTGANAKAWARAVAAAHGILNGTIPDPTGGGTFFFSSDTYDGTPANAKPGFGAMLKGNTIEAGSYLSKSTGATKNYFFSETKPKRARPR